MATNDPVSEQKVCLMCLETSDELKTVPKCSHVFCLKCLMSHQHGLELSSEDFCPTCHAASALSDADLDGLPDYDGPVDNGDRETVDNEAEGETECEPCRLKNKSVKAKVVCDECRLLYLCEDCSIIHSQNTATAGHAVIHVKSLRKYDSFCKTHEQHVTTFCFTCLKSCCKLCVFVEHGNHDVKNICDTFHSFIDELTASTEGQEEKAGTLKGIEGHLKFLQSSAVSKRRDLLLQQIENNAENWIEHIISKKEALKDVVLTTYGVVSEVREWLRKLPVEIPTLEKIVEKAKRMFLKAEPHPQDLQRLSVLIKEAGKVRIEGDVDNLLERLWKSFTSLNQNPLHFTPTPPSEEIGTLVTKANIFTTINTASQVCGRKYDVDDKTKFIPCVASFGNDLCAVAGPTNDGQPSAAIHIYKYPNELKQTINEEIPPLYDMVATPDNKLALLCNGGKLGTCSVQLFDPESSNITASKDLPVGRPLSFDVTVLNQYVILHEDGGRRRVTIFNENGMEELVHVFDEADNVNDAFRIRCGGEYIYTMGKRYLVLWRQEGQKLSVTYWFCDYSDQLKDIYVSYFDEIIVCQVIQQRKNVSICSRSLTVNKDSKTLEGGQKKDLSLTANLHVTCRLSVGENHIVMAHDNMFKVFKIT